MNEQLKFDQLEICLQALEAGASLEACVKLFPNNEIEFTQLIKLADETTKLANIPDPSLAKARNRTQIINEIHRSQQLKTKKKAYTFPQIAFAAIIVVAILILGTGSLFLVSAQPIPEIQSVSIKRVFENLRDQFIPRQEVIQSENLYKNQNVPEIQELLDKKQIETLSFSGIVEENNSAFMIIDNILVKIPEEFTTNIKPSPGDLVRIFGSTTDDGWISADNIIFEEKEITGTIESITSDQVKLSGTTFNLTGSSIIDKRVKVGDQVSLLFESSADGTLIVRGIIKHNPK